MCAIPAAVGDTWIIPVSVSRHQRAIPTAIVASMILPVATTLVAGVNHTGTTTRRWHTKGLVMTPSTARG